LKETKGEVHGMGKKERVGKEAVKSKKVRNAGGGPQRETSQ